MFYLKVSMWQQWGLVLVECRSPSRQTRGCNRWCICSAGNQWSCSTWVGTMLILCRLILSSFPFFRLFEKEINPEIRKGLQVVISEMLDKTEQERTNSVTTHLYILQNQSPPFWSVWFTLTTSNYMNAVNMRWYLFVHPLASSNLSPKVINFGNKDFLDILYNILQVDNNYSLRLKASISYPETGWDPFQKRAKKSKPTIHVY